MSLLQREDELKIFRKICGKKSVVLNESINRLEGNLIKVGYYNQGIARAKLKEYIDKNSDEGILSIKGD
ncbi:hypothetical protein [Wukongibacter baidiensis]